MAEVRLDSLAVGTRFSWCLTEFTYLGEDPDGGLYESTQLVRYERSDTISAGELGLMKPSDMVRVIRAK